MPLATRSFPDTDLDAAVIMCAPELYLLLRRFLMATPAHRVDPALRAATAALLNRAGRFPNVVPYDHNR